MGCPRYLCPVLPAAEPAQPAGQRRGRRLTGCPRGVVRHTGCPMVAWLHAWGRSHSRGERGGGEEFGGDTACGRAVSGEGVIYVLGHGSCDHLPSFAHRPLHWACHQRAHRRQCRRGHQRRSTTHPPYFPASAARKVLLCREPLGSSTVSLDVCRVAVRGRVYSSPSGRDGLLTCEKPVTGQWLVVSQPWCSLRTCPSPKSVPGQAVGPAPATGPSHG